MDTIQPTNSIETDKQLRAQLLERDECRLADNILAEALERLNPGVFQAVKQIHNVLQTVSNPGSPKPPLVKEILSLELFETTVRGGHEESQTRFYKSYQRYVARLRALLQLETTYARTIATFTNRYPEELGSSLTILFSSAKTILEWVDSNFQDNIVTGDWGFSPDRSGSRSTHARLPQD